MAENLGIHAVYADGLKATETHVSDSKNVDQDVAGLVEKHQGDIGKKMEAVLTETVYRGDAELRTYTIGPKRKTEKKSAKKESVEKESIEEGTEHLGSVQTGKVKKINTRRKSNRYNLRPRKASRKQ
ncbi:hypothetical protein LPJ72_002774 [Coemansia sp. Benny D160-2]|nr:hypothetical protein LPJ72_002774 [Coemansia sp. Benny D160-2]